MLVVLAGVAVIGNRVASRHSAPDSAQGSSTMLDDVELPRSVPNAYLIRDDGVAETLFELTRGPRTIVAVYAPWCQPCQVELPRLVEGLAKVPESLVVVVGNDEDPVLVRRQLDNLGLKALHYHVDAKEELTRGARVSALPTTLLLGRVGRVRDRVVGYASYRTMMLVYKVRAGGTDDAAGE
jgi:thiol-disulfide isomerase/thioredoxin